MNDRRDTESLTAGQAGPATNSVDAAVARWQSQLLQLNRRNNLLYFKGNPAPAPGSRRTLRCVPITGFSPDEIDEYLQGARGGRNFDYARRRRRRRRGQLEPATDDSVEPTDDIEFEPGDLPTDVEPLALQRVLLRFLRKEREWMEEQGINILFLAVGFLEWTDEEREQAKAPLLLLPCDLQRSSPREPFVLSREDDDATANATLRHKLREFDFDLPEFSHETYAAYLQEVSNLIEGRTGWRVTSEVVLSTFQYTKLAMWEDLEQMRAVGVTHPLVRRLAGETLTPDANGHVARDEFPPDSELLGGRLDDILDLRQEIAVLPADHSQLRAVAAARSGGNLVIHGPPGTGKSQTIVNIISNLLAHGKQVLFVSEKSVALDVVKDRLDQQGLGVFCLDMHSDRASKTSVYEQLRGSVEDNGQVTQFDYSYADLETSRASLNEVVRALHEPQQPLGRSIYHIHGEYAQLRDLPDVEFQVSDVASIDESRLREIGSLTERIARRPEEFRDLNTSKWKFLKTRAGSVGLADQLKRDATTTRQVVERAETFLCEQASLLGVVAPTNLDEASGLSTLARHLYQKPLVVNHWLNNDTLVRLRRVASEQRAQQQQALRLAARAKDAFGGHALAADYLNLSRTVRPTPSEAGALQRALGTSWVAQLMPDPATLLERATQVHGNAAELVLALDNLAKNLGSDSPSGSWTESARTIDMAREVVATGAVPDAWLDLNHVPRLKKRIVAAGLAHEALAMAEAELVAGFDIDLTNEVDNETIVLFHTDSRSDLRRLIGSASLKTSEPVHTAAADLVETIMRLTSQLESDLSPNSWRQTSHAIKFAHDLNHKLHNMDSVPEVWLEDDRLAETRQLVQEANSAYKSLTISEACLTSNFDIDLTNEVDDEALVRFHTDYRSDLQWLIGSVSLEVTESLHTAATALIETISQLTTQLGSNLSPNSWSQTSNALEVARGIAHDLHKMGFVHKAWLGRDRIAETRRLVRAASVAYEELRNAEARLFEEFDSEVVEAVDNQLLLRLRVDHQSSLRRLLGGAWRRDQRLLRGYAKVPRSITVDDALHVVQQVVEIRRLRTNWDETYSAVEPLIGPYASGRETDWDEIAELLDETERRLLEWPWDHAALRKLLTDIEARQALRHISDRADAEYQELQRALHAVPQHRLDREEIGPAGVAAITERASTALALLGKYSQTPRTITVNDGLEAVQRAVEIRRLRVNWDETYSAVEPLLGPYASERETDWGRIAELLDETERRLREWPWGHGALRKLLTDIEARQALRHISARADEEYRELQRALHAIPEHRLDREEVGPAGVAAITEQANTALVVLGKYSKTPRTITVNDGLEAVQRAVEIRKLDADWRTAYAAIRPHIYQHARSRETDWTQLEVLIDRVETLLGSWPWQQDRLQELLTNGEDLQKLDGMQRTAQTKLQSLEESLQDLESDCLDLGRIGPAGVAATVQQALAPLERLETATRPVIHELAAPPSDWLGFGDLVDDLAQLQSIEQVELASRDDLRRDFGEWFNDRETDWEGVLDGIQWCRTLLNLVDDKPSDRLRELLGPNDLPFNPNTVAEAIEAYRPTYLRDMRVLNERFEVAAAPWTAWTAAPFVELSDWLKSVHQGADSAANWLEFKLAADGLDGVLGSGAIRRIRDATDDAALVPGIVNRRLFTAWLDAASQHDLSLRDFTARDHEALRQEFQSLDRQLPRVLREQARTVLFERYPESRTSFTGSGQLGVLRGELTKRRRQLSVRQLLAAAPQLIQALKPCFLMSPLAVSQYLERTGATSANVRFDTVVFDEASQVLPEDAVPAISRAKQTIVVGDRRQLPPTTLFQHRYEHEDDDDDGDDETDWFEGRESILDVMVGMVGSGVAEHYLGVHYRSRHDSLIRYSNHYFYDDRLLTFPSPRKAAAHGVEAVYLPHGRYEAGGSRTNQAEAEKIVELVFELLRTRPESESVGVVALSRAQADLIEALVDEARLHLPEYENRFARGRQERFFVKNLENVQGDERDHILLSVGYGPTDSGRIPNRFGPINNEGGERRLNVAVSRARRSMTIVHSLRPEDITSESRGARLLKRYLEFARSPDTALEQNLSVNGQAETESPFEQAVRRALVERGHRVDVQVGVAGYRIDLAIKAEGGQGYALGIECDGAMYHSAPAARDRDWLRQSVLEGLGWTIHRVWSRAWIQNPERELEAIERSLQEPDTPHRAVKAGVAEVDEHHDSEGPDPYRTAVVSNEEWENRPVVNRTATDQTESVDNHFSPYELADLSNIRIGPEIRGERHETLHDLVTEIVRVEGPIHRHLVVERIRLRYGSGRVRGSTRELLLSVIRTAARTSLQWLPEEGAGATAQYMFLTSGESTDTVLPRAPQSDDSRRRVEHIALAELKAGVLVCAELLYGARRDDLISETARQFGFRRTGKDIASRIGKAVDQLVQAGKLAGDAEMLTVAD